MRPGRTAREDRQKRAQERAKEQPAHYLSLTPEQKLAYFDEKFGKGLGAKRERVRCKKQIEKARKV